MAVLFARDMPPFRAADTLVEQTYTDWEPGVACRHQRPEILFGKKDRDAGLSLGMEKTLSWHLEAYMGVF